MKQKQWTLATIKPDAVKSGAWLKIIGMYQALNLEIVDQIIFAAMPIDMAKALYRDHENKPYYKDLIEFNTSGPVIVLCLAGHDAVQVVRRANGPANPAEWEVGTIRKLYATDILHSAVHSSENTLDAARELEIFFPPPWD